MKRLLPRFLYGFASASIEPINMSVPWAPSDSDGLFQMNRSLQRAELANLRNWAHTNKGERVYDAEFGLDAYRHLFDPAIFTRDVLRTNAREQLSKYFSYLTIKELDFLTNEEDQTLDANSIRMILKAELSSDPSISLDINEVFQK